MISEKVITNINGLKLKDCATLAQKASTFSSEISIIKDNKKVNAKSIMGLLSLNIKHKDLIVIHIDGVDQDVAMLAIINSL